MATSTIKSIRLQDGIIDAIEKMGEQDNRTFSNMVETILLSHLKAKGITILSEFNRNLNKALNHGKEKKQP